MQQFRRKLLLLALRTVGPEVVFGQLFFRKLSLVLRALQLLSGPRGHTVYVLERAAKLLLEVSAERLLKAAVECLAIMHFRLVAECAHALVLRREIIGLGELSGGGRRGWSSSGSGRRLGRSRLVGQ
jgi:hypothetical protein